MVTSTPLSFFREKVCEIVSEATGLSVEDVDLVVEERFDSNFEFAITMPKVRRFKISGDPREIAEEWKGKIKTNEFIREVDIVEFGEGKKAVIYLVFGCDRPTLASKVLKSVFALKDQYGSTDKYKGEKHLFEFSSPNIAKPFHAGHLRSTVIGNCIKNVTQFLGADTVSINYLGDWGTQYGILAIGFSRFGDEESLQKDPIKHLFDIYVKTNQLITEDPAVRDEAREYFKKMEEGDEEALGLWKRFRDLSIVEYKKMYKRLNVEFDVYSGESLQSEGMEEAFNVLKEKNIGQVVEEGSYLIDLTKYKLGHCVVKKKDGSTLYITRDISAAVNRYREYNFDKSVYVVAAQQDLHFKQLFKILEMMEYEWNKKCVHVNFGMVTGMSTRRGNVVFLQDILNEAKDVMLERMNQNKMGKLEEIENPEETAETVGVSAIVIQDFSAKRIKNYAFDWVRMTSIEGHTGPFLQYTHARLCSMEDKTSQIELTDDIDYSLLSEKSAVNLIQQIGRFPLVLVMVAEKYEPSFLVAYLFDLAHAISQAHISLRVLGQEESLSKARRLLFHSGRVVLNRGLILAGLKPITRM